MIKSIYVDGFRSLLNFDVQFSEGLNVLVGQNGSGKTNFISSLDFISELTNEGIHRAFGNAGGTNRVFSEEVLKKRAKFVTFKIKGEFDQSVLATNIERYYSYSDDPLPPLVPSNYEYTVRIKYNKGAARVYVSEEEISLIFPNCENVQIKRKNTFSENGFNSKVSITPRNHRHVKTMARRRGRLFKEDFGRYLFSLGRQSCDENSCLDVLRYDFASAREIQRDIHRLKSINVEPAYARKPSLISDPPGLQSNGEGLSRTLWEIIEVEAQSARRKRPHSKIQHSYKEIVGWSAEVNQDIESIIVKVDQSRGVIIPAVVMKIGEQTKEFSFDKISDGTVKWIVLCVDLLYSNKFTAIEEPENFLHPRMQELFVELIRNVCQRNGSMKIITTHSESLLNLCKTNELIIFDFDENGTKAHRPLNSEKMQDVINSSEFNLGYFYRTGAVNV